MKSRRGLPNEEEWTYIRKDGTRIPVLLSISALKNSDGEIAGFLGVAQDISARKRAEEAQAKAAERLALATKAGGVGVWDYDVVNNRFVWDDHMFRLYGITRDQFGGAYEAWKSRIHQDDIVRADAEIQMALRGEKDFDTEFRVLWPDRSTHNIRAIATVKRGASGTALRMLGTNWDITAQKHSEAALLNANCELEEATVRANEMSVRAEMANVAKGEFLANMSHEIRTPISTLSSQ